MFWQGVRWNWPRFVQELIGRRFAIFAEKAVPDDFSPELFRPFPQVVHVQGGLIVVRKRGFGVCQ
jgi:hypothetical protein